MDKRLLKLSLITFILGAVILTISYFFFHYVTDTGLTFIKQAEAGKPFVTELIADLGVLFIFASGMSFIMSFIFKKDE